MNSSAATRLRLSIFAMAMALLLLAAGCSGESEPEEPEVALDELLANTGEELAAMSSAKFEMIDEMESGAKFFEATLKKVEGEVSNPDSVRLLVDVVAGLGFAEIEIVAIGEESYIKFSRDAPVATPAPRASALQFRAAGRYIERLAGRDAERNHCGPGVYRRHPGCACRWDISLR